MDEPIVARYRLTAERMAEGNQLQMKLARGWLSRAYMVATYLIALGCFGYLFANLPDEVWLLLIIVPVVVLLTASFVALHFFTETSRGHRAVARFLLGRMAEGLKNVEWRFSDEGIEQRTDLSASSTRWELVTRVVEIPAGFLIGLGRTAFHWVPAEGFDSLVDARLFAHLAERHAGRYLLIGECRTAGDPPAWDA